MENKPAIHELGDVFYGLQIQTKLIEDLFNGLKTGTRDLQDFTDRFNSQATLLNNQLKKIKPLVENVFTEGFNLISQKTE